ncbi:MAG TPA: response regulator [Planctomycetota bacterium]|nr:response regulator [Planctomycetota bacterium]
MSDEADAPVVVCVDDEPEILASLRRLLRKEPYLVLTTEKPDEAMTWVLDRKAWLLIADQRMPSMSGLDLLEMVQQCSPSTIRVMLSGQTDLTGVLKRSRIEAIEWLLRKPWDDEELKSVLRTLLARRDRQARGPDPRR